LEQSPWSASQIVHDLRDRGGDFVLHAVAQLLPLLLRLGLERRNLFFRLAPGLCDSRLHSLSSLRLGFFLALAALLPGLIRLPDRVRPRLLDQPLFSPCASVSACLIFFISSICS